MDDKRKQERRDEFNEKELKRYKELRIKLSKLESKQIEKSTAHWTTKNSQSKAMGENMKTFLSDQINHINTIKQGLLYHTKYESELHNKETEINNSYFISYIYHRFVSVSLINIYMKRETRNNCTNQSCRGFVRLDIIN